MSKPKKLAVKAKPRKLPQATIERICRVASGHLAKVEAGAEFIARSNEFINEHIKGIDYSAVKRGGSEGSSTEVAALAGTDDLTTVLAEFAQALENVGIWSRKMDSLLEKAETHWTEEMRQAAEFIARKSADAAAGGNCANCGRVVSGSALDQLRKGRCDACRKYWDRNLRERPRHLWGGDSLDDTCQTIRTHHGVDHSCALPWGHDEPCEFPTIEVPA